MHLPLAPADTAASVFPLLFLLQGQDVAAATKPRASFEECCIIDPDPSFPVNVKGSELPTKVGSCVFMRRCFPRALALEAKQRCIPVCGPCCHCAILHDVDRFILCPSMLMACPTQNIEIPGQQAPRVRSSNRWVSSCTAHTRACFQLPQAPV